MLVAIGIFTGGTCDGLAVTGCQFAPGSASSNPDITQRVTVGLLTSPTLLPAVGTAKSTMATAGLDGLVITGTRFDELSIAVLAFAALGGLRIEDNSVHGCYAGFWLIALDMPAFFNLTGSYDVQNVDRGTMTAVNSSVTSLALDPVFLMLYAVGRTYPLPAGYQPPDATPGTTVTATQWTTRLVERFTTGAVAEVPAAKDTAVTLAQPTAAITFGTGAASQADLVSGGGPANEAVRSAALSLIELEQQLLYPQVESALMLRFRGNWVECSQPARFTDTGVAGAAGQTSLALVVWDYSYLTRASISATKVTAGSLIAGDNQLTGNSSVVALVRSSRSSQSPATR